MFERLEKLINKEDITRLKNTSVLIIGVGGVVGYATEALVRSGVGRIIIIDNDVVDISNKNCFI